MRLRVYRRIACKDHGKCFKCSLEIFAGDEYIGEIFAYGDGHLHVMKQHVFCPDDEEEFWEEEEELKEAA